MPPSRYRESRILVRRLCRLPGEREEFTRKVRQLRRRFEQFNVDVSELCQWLMGLRKAHGDPTRPSSFGVLGDFLLSPELQGLEPDDDQRDAWRLDVFDDVAGFRPVAMLGGQPVPEALRTAMTTASLAQLSPSTARLFERLRRYERSHRFVLLKSTAEWLIARFCRPIEHWAQQRPKFDEERERWEQAHPNLTPAVRDQFTAIFKSLIDPEQDGRPGVRRRNPRICLDERLKENKDNCAYGDRGHSPLCWKYAEFVSACSDIKKFKERHKHDRLRKAVIQAVETLNGTAIAGKFNKEHFWENATRYIELRNKFDKSGPRSGGKTPHERALNELFAGDKKLVSEERKVRTQRFNEQLKAYRKALDVNDETILRRSVLPHCRKIGETGEKSQCEFNPHTELCRRYREELEKLPHEIRELEQDYREWRKLFLGGPRKPAFRYPSSRHLPTAKIFGEGHFELDLRSSRVRLRLDNDSSGEWLEFAFVPWPRKYDRRWQDVRVTSAHLNFVGSRARLGLRFEAPHKSSRFACPQDDFDNLRRSFRFPTEEREFLQATQSLLRESFQGDFDSEARILFVDLGRTSAVGVVYEGHVHRADVPLPIRKIDYCYPLPPEIDPQTLEPPPRYVEPPSRTKSRSGDGDDREGSIPGLSLDHVGRHLQQLSKGAQQLAEVRATLQSGPVVLHAHDFRGLQGHVKWMIRDWVRHNAARIVAVAVEHNCDLIVFENLRSIRVPGYDELSPEAERDKRQLAMFSAGRIRGKVSEKAVERGLRVVTVPEFRSSRICSECGHDFGQERWKYKQWTDNKAKGEFVCLCAAEPPSGKHGSRNTTSSATPSPKGETTDCKCGFKANSDVNAARVLARVLLGEISLPPRELTRS